MFYKKILTQSLTLPPSAYTNSLKSSLTSRIYKVLEGQSLPNIGLLCCIIDIISITQHSINSEGFVEFQIVFSALILDIQPGQCVDAIITEVSELGVFCKFGAVSLFVSNNNNVKCVRGQKIRMRIVGVKVENGNVFAIGNIKDEYLGLI